MSFAKRGEIYLVEFDPTRGSEIKKTRPAVVIQNDIGARSPSWRPSLHGSRLSRTRLKFSSDREGGTDCHCRRRSTLAKFAQLIAGVW